MFHNLNLDKNDPNYIMLDKIFKNIGSRKSKQIFSSNGFKNLKKLDTVIKTQFNEKIYFGNHRIFINI